MSLLPQTVALHIGTHKTASTHLQTLLFNNREVLHDNSVRFFGPLYLRKPDQDLGSLFDLSWEKHRAPEHLPKDQLVRLAKGARRVVFSEENFPGTLANKDGLMALPPYPKASARVAEFAGKIAPVPLDLFVAIRNPATYMASAYGQALMAQVYLGPRAFQNRNDWRTIDWAKWVADLRAIPGVRNLYVWRYEDYEDVLTLLLRRLTRWKLGPQLEPLSMRLHEGLSAQAVRHTLTQASEGKTGTLAHDARDTFPVSPGAPRFELYAPSVMSQATAIYAAQVAQIADLDGVDLLRPGTMPDSGPNPGPNPEPDTADDPAPTKG